jgi:hypothetical protein
MNEITRRRFFVTAAMSVAATRLREQGTAHVSLTIPAGVNGPHMPEDYVGLSYEVQQPVDPRFSRQRTRG